uniref:DDE Tnp4 domain-containing protein n=1 Tax=Brassica oleracea var. oleracea TaxID=109376 RepID=A0A0D2ZUP6_BRAOL
MASSSHYHYHKDDDDDDFDNPIEDFLNNSDPIPEPKERKKRIFIERNREEGHIQLWNDYFSENPTYSTKFFRRRFRMNKELFLRIVHHLSTEILYFRPSEDATGRSSLSPLQKCTAAIRQLAYGGAADTVDEYIRLAETTARKCLHNFTAGIITLFGGEYLRRPTPEDLERLLHIGEERGFPGMIGSIDSTFIQYIRLPQTEKQSLFAKSQESVRKDVERAFKVMQARFAVVKNPSKLWDKEKIGNIMIACIIIHNMIVEDERSSFTQYNKFEFQEREEVDTFSVNMLSNLGSTMDRRTNLRNRQTHEQLKNDLIENI